MRRSIRNRLVEALKRIAAVIICAAMIVSMVGPQKAKAANGVKRHIVLVLDTSGSSNFYDSTMTTLLYAASSPLAEVREATLRFISSLNRSVDEVYVSVVMYGDTAVKVCDFTRDYAALKTTIQTMGSIGGRKNMTAGLALAKEQLDSVVDSSSVNSVILVSPGMVDTGENTSVGHWSASSIGGNWMNSDTRIRFVDYSNVAYLRAEEIKATGAKIYGIGMMQMMDKCPESVKAPAQLFQNVMKDISSEGCFYPVYDAADFVFTFTQMAQDIVSGSKGTFKYSSINGGDYKANFYFEDEYFAKTAETYNPSLATMSMCLAMATFASFDSNATSQYQNAEQLLKDCGFDYIEANDCFKSDPNVDTMGVIIGYKNMLTTEGEFTLIALATRGAGYGNEWAGNFKVGETGNHDGFTAAKNEAKDFLNWYIGKYGKDFKNTVKLWMTGYSRAAATVNLLAGEISQNKKIGASNQISVTKDGIYAYCFETPRGLNTSVVSADAAKTFTNIHNIVNPNDFVPKVAMEGWGFIRYGVDENVIPSMSTDAYYNQKVAKMMSFYSAIGGDTIRDSYVIIDDYVNQETSVVNGIIAQAKSELGDKWDDSYKQVITSAWYNGDATVKVGKKELDFRSCPGYDMFTNAYDFRKGLAEMQRIRLNYYAGPTDPGVLTDKISKIDLYHLRSRKYKLANPWGVLDVYNAREYYTPDYSRQQGESLDNVLKKLTKELKKRSNYVDKIQTGLTAILREFYKRGGAFTNVTFGDLNLVEAIGGDDTLMWLGISLATTKNFKKEVQTIYDNLIVYMKDQKGVDLTKVLTQTELDEVKKMLNTVLEAVAEVAEKKETSDDLFSLISAYDLIPKAHYPELCFSWLASQDSNYSSSNRKQYVPYARRTIYINCPVDVVAKDSNGVIVAAFKDEESQTTDGYVLSGVTADGAKKMYLPTNEAYTVTITAREDCTMSFSINETDADDICEYIENYYDISMKQGETVTVTLPQEFFVDDEDNVTIVEADNVLRTKNGIVEADVILRGDDAKEAVYTVSVENENTAGGICYGGGDYVLGAYAKVTATEYMDCEFIGWYEDNELVSTDREYRFRVTRDHQLVARFEGETQYGHNGIFSATLVAEEGGYVDPFDTIYALDGYPVEVTAIAAVGYEFDGWVADGNCIIANADEQTTEVILIDEDVTLTAKFKKVEQGGQGGTDDPITDPVDLQTIEGVSVSYRTDATWTGGYNGSITIQNNSGHEINDWGLAFDMNANISGFWNAEVMKAENGQYMIKNGGWNGKIAAGQSITIGFTVTGNSVVTPTNFRAFTLKQQTGNSDCSVEFQTTATWNGGCNGELVITNTTGSTLKNWKVTFTCNGQVNSVWNGRILSKSGTTYTVGDDGSCPQLAPGATIRIGVNLNASGSDAYPKDFAVTGQ